MYAVAFDTSPQLPSPHHHRQIAKSMLGDDTNIVVDGDFDGDKDDSYVMAATVMAIVMVVIWITISVAIW